MNKRKKKGFTLIEVIIVLIILGVLIALVVPQVSGYISKAKETAALHNAQVVMEAVQLASIEGINTRQYNNGDLAKYLQKTEGGQLTYQVTVGTDGQVTSGYATTNGIQVSLPSLTIAKKE